MARSKIKDLSPRMRIPVAEVELSLPYMQESMGQQMGGLSMFSNSFKRGHGDKIFGSDENGIWLGAADYDDAPFKVDMDGRILSRSVEGNGNVTIDGANVRITMTDDNGDVRLLIGDDGS